MAGETDTGMDDSEPIPSPMPANQQSSVDKANQPQLPPPPSVLPLPPPPAVDLPPPPADPSQAAAYDPGILMLLGVMQAQEKKNEERHTTLRSDVMGEVDTVHRRVDAVEDEVATLSSTTAVAVRKVTVLENRQRETETTVKAIDQRVLALEAGKSGARSKTVTQVIEDEIAAVGELLSAAKAVSHIVVVGCHKRKEPTRQGIAELIKRFTNEIEVRYEVRGLVARVFFGFDGTATPSQRALTFFNDIISHQVASTYWAKVDEPRNLRDLKARARVLGEAIVEFCGPRFPGTENIRYTIVNGFLIVADVVVGPLTLLPGEDHHSLVIPRVAKIVLDPKHRPVDYKNPLGSQLRRSIADVLVKLFQKPSFIDTAEEILASSERTVPVTNPQAAAMSSSVFDSSDSSVSSEPESSSSTVAASAAGSRKRKLKAPKKKNKKKGVGAAVSDRQGAAKRPRIKSSSTSSNSSVDKSKEDQPRPSKDLEPEEQPTEASASQPDQLLLIDVFESPSADVSQSGTDQVEDKNGKNGIDHT